MLPNDFFRPPIVSNADEIGLDFDCPGLIHFGAGDKEGQNAVAVFSLDPVRIDPDRQSDGSIEAAGETFAAMNTGVVLVIQRLLSRVLAACSTVS